MSHIQRALVHMYTMRAVHMHRLAARTRIPVFNCISKGLAPRQTLHSEQLYNQKSHQHVLLKSGPAAAAAEAAACLCQSFVEYDTLQSQVRTYIYMTLRKRASCFSVRPASCSVSALSACNCLRGNCDTRWYVPGLMSGATVTSTQSKSVCNFCERANLQERRGNQQQIN